MNAVEMDQFPKWYTEYSKLGGQHPEQAFAENLNAFFEVVVDAWMSASPKKPDGTPWKDQEEAWDYWVGRIGSSEEARRYADAVNNVTVIYFKRAGADPRAVRNE